MRRRIRTTAAPPPGRSPSARATATAGGQASLIVPTSVSARAVATAGGQGRIRSGAFATATARGQARLRSGAFASATAGGQASLSGPAGYAKARRLVVPAASVRGGADLADFPLCVSLSGPWLRWQPNGGNVRHDQGWDIVFQDEATGASLDHDLELYDPVAGRLLAWVRLPRLSATAGAAVLMLYGRDGLTRPTENPAGVWVGYEAVWHLPETADRTGNGHDLTLSGVQAGELLGRAGLFDGLGAHAYSGPIPGMSGLSQLAVQVRCKADVAPVEATVLSFRQGPETTSGTGFQLSYENPTDRATNGTFGIKNRLAGGAMVLLDGVAGAQNASPRSFAYSWTSGTAGTLHADGAPIATSHAAAGTGSSDWFGAGILIARPAVQSTRGFWDGSIDEVRLCRSALTAGRIATEHACQSAPDRFYGLGDEEDHSGGEAAAVVALPGAATVTAGQASQIDLPFRARAGSVVSAIVASARVGSVALPPGGGTKATYTAPAALAAFDDEFGFSVSTPDGRTSSSLVALNVLAGGAAGLPYETPPPGMTTLEPATTASFRTRIAALQRGQILDLEAGDYTGALLDITVSGTAAQPVIIRSKVRGQAKLKCAVALRGDHVWLVGFECDDGQTYVPPTIFNSEYGGTVVVLGQGNRVLRCNFVRRDLTVWDKNPLYLHYTSRSWTVALNTFQHAISAAAHPRPTREQQYKCNFVFAGVLAGQNNHAGSTFARNHVKASLGGDFWTPELDASKGEYEFLKSSQTLWGRSDRNDFDVVADILILENRFQDGGKEAENTVRCAGLTFRGNTFIGNRTKLRLRFASSDTMIGNWFEDCDPISCRGDDHKFLFNMFAAGSQLDVEAGNLVISDLRDTALTTKRPVGRRTLLVGNQGRVIVGNRVGTDAVTGVAAQDTTIRGHKTLAGAAVTAFGTVVSSDNQQRTTFAANLLASDVAVTPVKLGTNEVGVAYLAAPVVVTPKAWTEFFAYAPATDTIAGKFTTRLAAGATVAEAAGAATIPGLSTKSGMPWPVGWWNDSQNGGNLAGIETRLGRPMDWGLTFWPKSFTVADADTPLDTKVNSTGTAGHYDDILSQGMNLCFGVPFMTSDFAQNFTGAEASAALLALQTEFIRRVRLLKARYPNRTFYARIAHEMNGHGGFPWGLRDQTDADYAAYRRLHQRWHAALKHASTGVPGVVVVWNPLKDPVAYKGNFDSIYPGDAFVDVIALDYYDNGTANPQGYWQQWNGVGGEAGKAAHYAKWLDEKTAAGIPIGPRAYRDLAIAKGKGFGLVEWGLTNKAARGTGDADDRPWFVEQIALLCKDSAERMGAAFMGDSYFHTDGDGGDTTLSHLLYLQGGTAAKFPLAGAKYEEKWKTSAWGGAGIDFGCSPAGGNVSATIFATPRVALGSGEKLRAKMRLEVLDAPTRNFDPPTGNWSACFGDGVGTADFPVDPAGWKAAVADQELNTALAGWQLNGFYWNHDLDTDDFVRLNRQPNGVTVASDSGTGWLAAENVAYDVEVEADPTAGTVTIKRTLVSSGAVVTHTWSGVTTAAGRFAVRARHMVLRVSRLTLEKFA